MGQTAEMAIKFAISREEQDGFAGWKVTKAVAAQKNGNLFKRLPHFLSLLNIKKW